MEEMLVNYYSVSKTGDREINEDSTGIIKGTDCTCFIVADGLGGHGKGDIASQIAVSAFQSVFEEKLTLPMEESLASAFQNAQNAIISEQQRQNAVFQMKTTVAAVVIGHASAICGHIGDTRIYTFARNRIRERTLDHSVPQMLVLSREIKEKQIRNHPDRNKLLRVLGVQGDIKIDSFRIDDLSKYQAVLLCSDGFWELILEKEMCRTLKKSCSAQEWIMRMCEIVERNGQGKEMDNYSAIAIWL